MTLSITAVQDYGFDPTTGDPLPPRVLLTVTSTTGSPNPVPANSQLTLTRIHADGSEHRVLTAADPRVITGSWIGYDYHLPYNQDVTYRVTAAGASVTTAAVYVEHYGAWLIHPSDVALSVMIDKVTSVGSRSAKSRAGRFEPGGALPIFISDGRRSGLTGTLVIRQDREAAVHALIEDDSLLLINTPGTDGWRVGWMWVSAQVEFSNPVDGWVFYTPETITLSWEEAQEPDADLTDAWNAGTAAAYFAANGINAGAVASLYANALALQTNTPL